MTYNLFKDTAFCPIIFSAPFKNITYPVFLKPNIGQGGKGTSLANNEDELLYKLKNNQDLLVCEHLPGDELSVDCFTANNGKLLFIGPRMRSRIEMGISFTTYTIPLSFEIKKIAENLNEKLSFNGAWFFQVKKDSNGIYKLMEFAARQSSTMALYRQQGVNFALLSIFNAMEYNLKIINQNFNVTLDRCLSNSYKLNLDYNQLYIDYDDTIIINDKINSIAVKFLYQCKNNNIKVCLLTKHRYNLEDSLKKYCLDKGLFDEIIILKMEEDKVKYIDPIKSIFIDNYFFDREQVKNKLNIPVFDVDAIECLLK